MSYTKQELRSMLEDVVTALDLDDEMIKKHGPSGPFIKHSSYVKF